MLELHSTLDSSNLYIYSYNISSTDRYLEYILFTTELWRNSNENVFSVDSADYDQLRLRAC